MERGDEALIDRVSDAVYAAARGWKSAFGWSQCFEMAALLQIGQH
jgi:hypothetical protein